MFDFQIAATSGAARTGTLTLPHGPVETPVFMPVGTQGTVRALSPADLKAVGAAAAHRFGRIPGVLARRLPPRGRRRRRVPESCGRRPSHPHPRARHGDPMDPRRRHCDGVRPRGAGSRGRGDIAGCVGENSEMVGTVRPQTWGTDGTMERWTDRPVVPTFQRSIVPPDIV